MELTNGAPVAGASVLADTRGRGYIHVFATTDDQGRFEVPWTGSAWFEARAEGFASARIFDDGAADELTLRVDRTGALTGRVLSRDDGSPAPGAVVHVASPDLWLGTDATARASDDGTFRVDGVAPGEMSVYVFGGGWASVDLASGRRGEFNPFAVAVESGATVAVDLRVERAARVEGRVVDPRGAPVAAISVARHAELPYTAVTWSGQFTTTGSEGTFAFEDVLPGVEHTFAAVPLTGFPSYSAPLRIASGETASVEIRLGPARRVHVTVLDEGTDAPIAGASVTAAPLPRQGFLDPPGGWATDSAGEADLGPVPDGVIVVRARAAGHVAMQKGVTAEEVDATLLRAVVRLAPAKILAGRVVAPEGVSAAGLPVHASASGTYVDTEADGSFRFDALADGETTVSSWMLREGRNYEASAKAHAGDQGVVLSLAPSPEFEVRLRVTDDAGAPIDSAWLRWSLRGTSSSGGSDYVVDGAAILTVSSVPCEGPLEVLRPRSSTGRAPLPGSSTLRIEVSDPPPAEILVRLPAERRISGHVVDAGGSGVRGVRVVAHPKDGRSWSEFDAHGATTSGEDGSFELRRLGDATYRLSLALPPGFSPVAARDVAAGATDVEFRLVAGTEVTVTVLDPEGRPLGDCAVWAGGVWARTAADGRVRLPALDPARAWTLRVVPPRASKDLVAAEVDAWTPRDVQVRLERAYAVAGVVRDAAGRAVGGATVFHAMGARWDPMQHRDGARRALTGPDGRFRIPGLRAGDWIRLRAAGGPAANLDHSLGRNVVAATAGDEDVVLFVDTAGSVVVRVEGIVPGATVGYRVERVRTARGRTWTEPSSGSLPQGGVLHLSGLDPDGEFRFSAGPTREGDWAVSGVLVPGGNEVVLRMTRGEPLAGRAVLPADADASLIRVTASGSGWSAHVDADPDGAFRFAGLPPGECVVTASAWLGDRITWKSRPVTTAAGADVTLALEPSPAR